MENYIMSLKGNVDYSITILRFATAFGISPRMRFDLIVNHFVKDAVLNGKLDMSKSDEAIKKYNLNPEKPSPITV